MNTLLATYRTHNENACGNDAVLRPGHPEDVDRAAREGSPKVQTRDCQFWAVIIHDTCDHHEPDSVAIFDEGTTELEVIQSLWADWVYRPYLEDKEDDPNNCGEEPPGICATWGKLAEWVGEDYVFEPELRTIKVKV